MIMMLGAGLAQAQSDYLTFTGVWTTLPFGGLITPSAVTGDAAGNLYVTDEGVSTILKLAADGVTQTTVGSGLNDPLGITIDASGNLYVTSNGDNKVYKITPGGTQTALGTGWSSPVSVAVDGNGNVFVTDSNGLSEYTAGGVQSPLVSGNLRGVAVDAGNNIWYADNTYDSINEILAGDSSGTEQYYIPHAQNLFIDAAGSLYAAETAGGVQRHDDPYGYTTFGNTAASYGVWGDTHQNLYIADHTGTVQKLALGAVDFGSVNVCPTGATVTPCAATQVLNFGLDTSVTATISSSRALTQGVANLDYQVTADTCTTVSYGSPCSETMTFAPHVSGLSTGALEAVGGSLVLDVVPARGTGRRASHAHALRPHDEPPGTVLASVLLHGIGIAPVGVFNTAAIMAFPDAPLSNAYLSGVAVGSKGYLYITDVANCVVQEDNMGSFLTVAGTGDCGADSGDSGLATSATLNHPWKTAIDGAGNLYISEPTGSTVRRVDGYTGIITTLAGTGSPGYAGDGGPATSALLNTPTGVVVDTGGNLFIADTSNNLVRRVDAVTGIITTIAGNGTAGYTGDHGAATSAELNQPDALAIDNAGDLYIADDNNNVVRKVAGGVITTIAGNGTAGYAGDGGQATSAELNDPEGLAVDPAGNVYIADSKNYLVREVNVGSGIITTVAGAYTGTEAYSGDNGEAILAGLSYDEDVAFYGVGAVVIADSDNGAIRYVYGRMGLANFGSVALGSTSPAQDSTLSNVGTSALVLAGLQITPNFTTGGADTTCTSTTTLAVNADCVFGIEMTPTVDGPLTGNLVIADNNGNSPGSLQGVVLAGTGTGSTPAELAFAAPVPPINAGGNLGTVMIDVESSTGVLTGAGSLVTLTITGPGGYSQTLMVAAVNGVASFNLSSRALVVPGTYTLTATSPDLTQAQTTTTVTVNLAAPAELAIPSPVPTTIPSGASLGTVPVDIENSSGTLIADATNPVTLTITGPGGYSHSVTVAGVNGVANFNLSSLPLTTPGIYTLTATSAGLNQAQATVTVTPVNVNTPVQLVIPTPPPATIGSGNKLGPITIDIDNSAGALVATATNAVTLVITGPGGYSYTVTAAGVNGVVSFDLSSVTLTTPGTYTLTFTSNYLTAAVATITVSVDFTIAVTSGTPAASAPIIPGLSAAYAFTLAPAAGSFPAAITLTATGLPSGATYSFSPATVTPGNTSAATALTIQTAPAVAALHEDHSIHWPGIPWIAGRGAVMLGLVLLPLSSKRRRLFKRGPLLSLALLLLALGAFAGLGGCGAGGLFGQPQQSYTVTVTGTSGPLSHSATVTLTVQ